MSEASFLNWASNLKVEMIEFAASLVWCQLPLQSWYWTKSDWCHRIKEIHFILTLILYCLLQLLLHRTHSKIQRLIRFQVNGEMTLSIYQACHNYVVIGATFTYFIIIQDLLFQLKCHWLFTSPEITTSGMTCLTSGARASPSWLTGDDSDDDDDDGNDDDDYREHLHLEFRTNHQSGLLFYTGGRNEQNEQNESKDPKNTLHCGKSW